MRVLSGGVSINAPSLGSKIWPWLSDTGGVHDRLAGHGMKRTQTLETLLLGMRLLG